MILLLFVLKEVGVHLDLNLNIKDHTDQTYKKFCSCLQLLKRLHPKLTTKATVIIYQSMILSLVTYCSFVTYSSASYMKKAKSLYSRADLIIGNNGNQSLLEPIDSAMKKHLCKHVFKILIGEPFCNVFRDYFETIENNTRNNNCIIRFPATKLEPYRQSFQFYGGNVFNGLPHLCGIYAQLQLH